MKPNMAKINIYNINKSSERSKKPYRLKWSIDNRHKSRNFATLGEASKFKRKLEQALEDGYNFDPNSGLPELWVAQLRGFADVAREYTSSKWHEWAGNTRFHFCDSNAVVVYELIRPKFKSTYERNEVLKVIREHILNQIDVPISEREAEIKEFVLNNTYRLKEITPEIVTKTIHALGIKMNGKPASKDYLRKRKQTLGAVLDFAYRHRYINDNPYKRVKIKPQASITPIDPYRAMSPDKCRDICQALRNLSELEKGHHKMVADVLEFLWLAGLRPSEAVALQKKHIKLFRDGRTSYIKVEQASVTLTKKFTEDQSSGELKGLKAREQNSFRTVPILDELLPTVQRVIEGKKLEDFLFTSPKDPESPARTRLIYDYFVKATGGHHSPYDMRHTNASILIAAGLSVVEVANRLGNSIEVCQKVYLHLFNKAEEINLSRENEYLARESSSYSKSFRPYVLGA